jgi:PAS domain S-box-containing protein
MIQRVWSRLRSRSVLAAAAACAMVAVVPFVDWGGEEALPIALGLLAALLAGAFGGIWVGLVAAGAAFALYALFVADDSARALVALPAWLAIGAVGGLLAVRFRRERRERDLLATELSAVRAAAGEAVVGLDAEGTIRSWNAGAERIYGYAPDDVLGRPVSILSAPEAAGTDVMEMLEAIREGDGTAAAETVQRRKDGVPVTVSLSVAPVRDHAGDIGSVFAARDVGAARELEERLGEVETKHRALTFSLQGVTYVHPVGQRARPLSVSPQIEQLAGYTPGEWLSTPGLVDRVVHPDDRERLAAELKAAESDATQMQIEYRMLARDGRVVWVCDECVVVRDAEGRPLYTQGHLVDVTTSKRATDEQARLRAAEENALADARGRQQRLELVGEAASALALPLEYERAIQTVAQLVTRDLADWCTVDLVDEESGEARRIAVAHAEPADLSRAPDTAVIEAEVLEVVRRRVSEVTRDRMCVPIVSRGHALGAVTLVSATPDRSYGSDDLAPALAVAATIGMSIDRARLHREVEERADAARVLTFVGDGVVLLDRAGTIRLWNPAAEAITGLTADVVLGRRAVDAIPAWATLVERIPVGAVREPVAAETLPLETDQGERWISISGVRFFDGTVYAFRDLTEAHKLEELKAEFLATASHELRTPLAAVYGAAQTLRRHDFALDEAGRDRFISLIVDESDRLGRIVNEILLANQLESGRLGLSTEAFDPAELLERIVEGARLHAPAGIELEVSAPKAVPLLNADRDKVRQIVINLIENGMKYSPLGGLIQVGVEVESDDAMVVLFVRDQGLGIPREEQARIFDKFYRLDPEMTRGVGGTGLGLYICSELVERMGGRIWVESPGEGAGSTFCVALPAAETAPARGAETSLREPAG